MKKIEVVIGERFYVRGGKIFQHFIYDKRYDKPLRDLRLSVYEQFETKIKEKSLNLYFIKRREEPGKVILEYEFPEGSERPSNSYFTLMSFLPDNMGCDFCKHCKKGYNGSPFVWCEVKQKALSHKIKNCKFFRQKNENF